MFQVTTILRRHWKPLLALNSAILGSAVLIALLFPRTWEADARFILPINTSELDANIGTLGQLRPGDGVPAIDTFNPMNIQAEIIKSSTLLEKVMAIDPERDEHSLQSFMQLFEVSTQPLSPLMSIQVKADSPELAYQRLSNLIKLYQQRLKELRQSDSSTRQQFPEAELQNASRNLQRAQAELSAFKRANKLVDVNEQLSGLVRSIADLENTYATALAQSRSSATQARELSERLQVTPQTAIKSLRLSENKDYQLARDRLSQVETALAEARGTLTDDNPRVQDLLDQRQKLSQLLNQRLLAAIPGANMSGVDKTLSGGNAGDRRVDLMVQLIQTNSTASGQHQQAKQLYGQLVKLNQELSRISSKQSQLLELQRRYDIAEGLYKGLFAQSQQATISALSSYPSIQLLDGPINNPRPEPRRMLILMGGVVAMLFGSAALLLFLESRNPLLRPSDIQKASFSILSKVPRLKSAAQVWDLDAEPQLAFQRLASAISFLQFETPRFMITSAMYGEGKTTTTIGLAAALTRLGFKVLVVDGDLRQAQLTERLGYRYNSSWDPHHPVVCTILDGLDLMPAPPIPKDRIVNYFASGHFDQQLQAVQQSGNYDYVLVDSAPISLTSETTIMTGTVNNLLFVVRPGTSSRYSVLDSFEQLSLRRANVVGVVINGIDSHAEEYYYGQKRDLASTES